MDLSTEYLGFRLPHPIMPGASPMVDDLGLVRRLEDSGAAAIVMHSLFEEDVTGLTVRQSHGQLGTVGSSGEPSPMQQVRRIDVDVREKSRSVLGPTEQRNEGIGHRIDRMTLDRENFSAQQVLVAAFCLDDELTVFERTRANREVIDAARHA